MGVDAGELLDERFRVEEALDQGGMGSIWTATELMTGQRVAVKVLRLDAYTLGRLSPADRVRRRAELLKRFEREGAVLDELDHPGIPRLLHRGYLDEEPYLVMEYVDGINLREFLDRRRPFPFGAAIAVAFQIAEALVHAHGHGVVHRDLKPDNIVVAHCDGTVKLLDFGIVHLTDPDATRYTALGDTPGSAGYMAPEQIRGQHDILPAADAYAFGCLLFELLAGERPFEARPDRSMNIQHLEDLPRRLRSINVGIPEDLDDLVWDLLAKSPADRPAGIVDVLDVLRRYVPRPGDPAPDPELYPDPTARYRLGGRRVQPRTETPGGGRRPARRTARRRGSWLSRGEFGCRIELARSEFLTEGPGDQCAALGVLLPKAASDWGMLEPVVVQAQLLCADIARLDGDTDRAHHMYRAVVAGTGRWAPATLRPLVLEAEFGVAECLVPAGDIQGALAGWRDATRQLEGLDPVPPRLVERCREIALELGERGREAEVAAVITHLPRL
ncbi:serine/threonine-protein kinase [Streptomyces sp. NPDC049577]|uniref:serine/threonine-protein kinase n=1 Tax=Streptomyces sp. NPDC049577 TaxID=3155153 RepID=UPI00342ADE5F